MAKTTEESIQIILDGLYNLSYIRQGNLDQDHYETILDDYLAVSDKEFSTTEIDAIFLNLKTHIAAGPEQIKTPFVQALYKDHKAVFLNIFNTEVRSISI